VKLDAEVVVKKHPLAVEDGWTFSKRVAPLSSHHR